MNDFHIEPPAIGVVIPEHLPPAMRVALVLPEPPVGKFFFLKTEKMFGFGPTMESKQMNKTRSEGAEPLAPTFPRHPKISCVNDATLEPGSIYINQTDPVDTLGIENHTGRKIGLQVSCVEQPGSNGKKWLIKLTNPRYP